MFVSSANLEAAKMQQACPHTKETYQRNPVSDSNAYLFGNPTNTIKYDIAIRDKVELDRKSFYPVGLVSFLTCLNILF